MCQDLPQGAFRDRENKWLCPVLLKNSRLVHVWRVWCVCVVWEKSDEVKMFAANFAAFFTNQDPALCDRVFYMMSRLHCPCSYEFQTPMDLHKLRQ